MGTEAIAATVPHGFVLVRGQDPLGFLQAMTTQEVGGLAPMEGTLACLLTDKGRVRAAFRALPLSPDEVLLDGDPAIVEPLLDGLGRIAPLSGCEVRAVSDEWSLTVVRGPRAGDALTGFGPLPAVEHHAARAGGALLVRVEWGGEGYDVLAPEAPTLDGVTRASEEQIEAMRIAGGRPRFGVDVTEDLLVNETPYLARAVSFTKGCYPGQESVARVQNLGRPRRRFARLRLDAVASPGAPVRVADEEVGAVTSAAAVPGGAVALALVRSEVADGAEVEVAGARGTLHAL